MTSELVRHYADAAEHTRLTRTPHGRLEFRRTQELLSRVLPDRATVLDVGGGTGIHAGRLAAAGHRVHLLDVVPAHTATAAALPGVTAGVGDARRLPISDGAVDVVLLLGPLYHLTEPDGRAAALAEARRVLRPGGVLAAAGINRYLSLLEAGSTGALDATLEPAVRAAVRTGGYDGHLGFTATHWHTAAELRAEVGAAGFGGVEVYGVEGPAWPALDTAGLPAFDARVDAALRAARLVERDPALIHASAHLLALAQAG